MVIAWLQRWLQCGYSVVAALVIAWVQCGYSVGYSVVPVLHRWLQYGLHRRLQRGYGFYSRALAFRDFVVSTPCICVLQVVGRISNGYSHK